MSCTHKKNYAVMSNIDKILIISILNTPSKISQNQQKHKLTALCTFLTTPPSLLCPSHATTATTNKTTKCTNFISKQTTKNKQKSNRTNKTETRLEESSLLRHNRTHSKYWNAVQVHRRCNLYMNRLDLVSFHCRIRPNYYHPFCTNTTVKLSNWMQWNDELLNAGICLLP